MRFRAAAFVVALTIVLCRVAAMAAVIGNIFIPPPTYTGFNDAYPSAGATWGFSTCRLSRSYGGNFGIIQRQSDSATTTISFGPNNCANVSAFNTFCAGTNCSITTIYDQINGNNATCTNVRAFVASNGYLAIAPGPSGQCTVPYASVYSTAKQELFAVAMAAYLDNRYSQSGLPTVTVTGNVASGGTTVTSMSSQTGISTTTNYPNQPSYTGVVDSAAFIPLGTYLSSFPSGSVGQLGFNPGNLTITGNQTGDTLTFTNAVLGGVWIMQGPASPTFESSAYWGFGVAASDDPGAGYTTTVINAVQESPNNPGRGANIGEGMLGAWGVWDVDTYTNTIYYDGVQAGNSLLSSANVTYSTSVGLTLFTNANGSQNLQNSAFEQMVLINQTAAARAAMGSWFATQFGITFPTSASAWATSDGFTMKPEFLSSYPAYTGSAYGDYSVTDANGITWNPQTGGYVWPSEGYATNVNNGGTLWRFIVQSGDADINLTDAERSEVASSNETVTPGNYASLFYQFEFETLASQTGDWCATQQVHYSNVSQSTAPDAVSLSCKNGQLQLVYQKGSSTTNCGSAITLTPGHVYAVNVENLWSTNHTSDTLDGYIADTGAYPGNTSTTLTHQCTASGALFATDTAAYPKMGIYRGYPWANSGNAIERVMNYLWSNTQNAYSGYRTTQPAIPTHS